MLEIDQVLLQSLLLQLCDVRDVSFRCRIQESQLFSLSGCGFYSTCTVFCVIGKINSSLSSHRNKSGDSTRLLKETDVFPAVLSASDT